MQYHKELTPEKWASFPKQVQIMNIGAEISRAQSWQDINKKEKTQECLERAMELLDLTIQDKRWQDQLGDLLRIREALGYFYASDSAAIIYKVFLDWLTHFAREN